MKINVCNGAYQHASQATNYQRCVNMYPVAPGPDGRGATTLLPRWGKKTLCTLGSNDIVRGLVTFGDNVYAVADETFYKITIDYDNRTAAYEELGTLNESANHISMATSPYQIMIVNGTTTGYVYSPVTYRSYELGPIGGTASDTYNLTINTYPIYTAEDVSTALTQAALIAKINTFTDILGVVATANGASAITLQNVSGDNPIIITESGTGFTAGTDGITASTDSPGNYTAESFLEIDDTDFVGGSCCAYLDGYFFYAGIDTNKFYASQLHDALAWDALDFASAEITNAPIVNMAVKNRQLWLFKTDAIEVWYDAANASGMPLSPRVGSEVTIGCIAPGSLVSVDNTLYWFDSRRVVSGILSTDSVINQTSTNTAVPVSTDALNNEFSTYSVTSDAVGCSYQERGHSMYQITFPTMNKTWVLDLSTKQWHERTHFNSTFSTTNYDLAQFATTANGFTILGGYTDAKIYISDYIYKDDADTQINAIRTTQPFEQDFKLIGVDRLELRCNSGYANQSGSGSDPYVTMRYSNDGGHTWSYEQSRSLGLTGQYGLNPTWNRLGSAREWIFEFSITSPIDWSIVDASVDITEVEQY